MLPSVVGREASLQYPPEVISQSRAGSLFKARRGNPCASSPARCDPRQGVPAADGAREGHHRVAGRVHHHCGPKKLMLRTLRDRRGQDKEAGPWRRAPEQMPARTPLQHHVLSTTPWIISGWASCRASRGASASTLACWFSARLEPIDLGPFRGLREGLQVRRRPVVLHHLLHLSLIIIFFGMYYLCNK